MHGALIRYSLKFLCGNTHKVFNVSRMKSQDCQTYAILYFNSSRRGKRIEREEFTYGHAASLTVRGREVLLQP